QRTLDSGSRLLQATKPVGGQSTSRTRISGRYFRKIGKIFQTSPVQSMPGLKRREVIATFPGRQSCNSIIERLLQNRSTLIKSRNRYSNRCNPSRNATSTPAGKYV